MSIIPTSVEADKVFFATGLFVTKIPSGFSDEFVNALSCLRNYFDKSEQLKIHRIFASLILHVLANVFIFFGLFWLSNRKLLVVQISNWARLTTMQE